MQYFILLPGDSEKDCYTDNNLLGEESFKTFYAGSGFRAFIKLVNNSPDLLSKVIIKTDRNQSLTVEEFLTKLQPLKVLINE